MFRAVENKYRSCPGCNVTVFGGVFNAMCYAVVGNEKYSAIDFDEDYVTFAAPNDIGEYSFYITDGITSSIVMRLAVVENSSANVYRLPERGEEEFTSSFVGLMPTGFGWNVRSGTNFYKLLSAIASPFLSVYNMLKNVVKQSSPFTTEDYSTWERELALPRKGIYKTTSDGRKKEILRISRGLGSFTVPHFQKLIDIYGVDAEIYEYHKNPELFPSWVSEKGGYANFYVLVKVYRADFGEKFKCNSKCNAPISDDRDLVLESLLDFDKPAHVQFVYSYNVAVLTDENEKPLLDEAGRMILARG